MTHKALKPLFGYSLFVITYIVFVIVWGAYVRATGSGAGCGSHWPLCNGTIIPREPNLQTQIEYFHRLTSGLSLIFVVGLSIAVLKKFKNEKFIRKLAKIATISIIMEALIGAGLVLFELVSHNQSIKRTVSVSLHFVNTLVLLGTLTLISASIFRSGSGWKAFRPSIRKAVVAFTTCFFLIGMAGAITALGDTLFPATSLVEGLSQDLQKSSHFLIKLRMIHPLLAFSFGLFLTPWVAMQAKETASLQKRKLGRGLIFLITLNITLGILNIIWLAPVWLQMLHLSVALIVWINWMLWVDFLATETL